MMGHAGAQIHRLYFPAPPGPHPVDQINEGDRQVLRSLAMSAKRIVDVGTFLGGSAEALCQGMPKDGKLFTVDTFEGSGLTKGRVSKEAAARYARDRLSRFNADVIVGDSREVAASFDKESADLVFLDGAHDYENVMADIKAWLPSVKPNGVLAGHDFDKHWTTLGIKGIMERSHLDWDRQSGLHCGVIRAVLESFAKIEVPPQEDSSIWWVKPEWAK